MENSNSNSKLSTLTTRFKQSTTQITNSISNSITNFKTLIQPSTPESRLVNEATSPLLTSPNWSLNLRICSLINSQQLNPSEVVKSIKKIIVSNNNDAVVVKLAVELLEVCAVNCEKFVEAVAAEGVVEVVVEKVVENEGGDRECRVRAMELIRGWGESEELSYLPVFRRTYENLKRKSMSAQVEDGAYPPVQYSLESYIDDDVEHGASLGSYTVPGSESNGVSNSVMPYNLGSLSAEQKKEFLEITKNSLEVLSSMLNSEADSKVVEEELTINMLDKCKDSQPVLQMIVQSTNDDDETLLFEALNLNDELQRVLSKFEEMQVSRKSDLPPEVPKESQSTTAPSAPSIENAPEFNKSSESPKVDNAKTPTFDLFDDDEDTESISEKK